MATPNALAVPGPTREAGKRSQGPFLRGGFLADPSLLTLPRGMRSAGPASAADGTRKPWVPRQLDTERTIGSTGPTGTNGGEGLATPRRPRSPRTGQSRRLGQGRGFPRLLPLIRQAVGDQGLPRPGIDLPPELGTPCYAFQLLVGKRAPGLVQFGNCNPEARLPGDRDYGVRIRRVPEPRLQGGVGPDGFQECRESDTARHDTGGSRSMGRGRWSRFRL